MRVDRILSKSVKQCILDRSIAVVGARREANGDVSFRGRFYALLSLGIMEAPASDLGYAAVFEAEYRQDASQNARRLLKLGFNVYPSGRTNLINPFEMVFNGQAVEFYEYVNEIAVRKDEDCLSCHRHSSRHDLTLGVQTKNH